MGKLKQRKASPGKKLKPDFESKPYPQFQHPVFCFRYLSKKYGLNNCDKNDKAALIEQLHRLSQMTWTEIKMAKKMIKRGYDIKEIIGLTGLSKEEIEKL